MAWGSPRIDVRSEAVVKWVDALGLCFVPLVHLSYATLSFAARVRNRRFRGGRDPVESFIHPHGVFAHASSGHIPAAAFKNPGFLGP